MYLDGQLVVPSSVSAMIGANTLFGTNIETTTPSTNSNYGAFHLGQAPQSTNWEGTIDELAIFSADLSPQDVNPTTGAVIPGVQATRFLQMYNAGTPN